MAAAASRRLASASYSENQISPDSNIKPDQEKELTIPSLVLMALFFVSSSLLLLGDFHGTGDGGGGMLLGTSPKEVLGASTQVYVIDDLTHH